MALQLGLIPSADVEPDQYFNGLHFIDQNSCDVPRRLVRKFMRFVGENFYESTQWDLDRDLNVSSSYGAVMEVLYQRFLTANQYNESDVKILNGMFRASK